MVSIKYKAQKNLHTDSSSLKLPGTKHTHTKTCTQNHPVLYTHTQPGNCILSGWLHIQWNLPIKTSQNSPKLSLNWGKGGGDGGLNRESKMWMPYSGCGKKKEANLNREGLHGEVLLYHPHTFKANTTSVPNRIVKTMVNIWCIYIFNSFSSTLWSTSSVWGNV